MTIGEVIDRLRGFDPAQECMVAAHAVTIHGSKIEIPCSIIEVKRYCDGSRKAEIIAISLNENRG